VASEPKTRPTDASVEEFIAAVENPRRQADARVVNALLTEVSGETPVMWGPAIIGYGSYHGSTGDWPRIGFSPRKTNLSLYVTMPGSKEDAPLLARLGKHKTSVACLYVNKLDDIDLGVLRELATQTWEAMRAKYPE
jgi:hypothetical protein